jgi:hypothetical protein
VAARYFALIAGIVYLFVGILGFIPGINDMTHPGMAEHDLIVDAQYGFLLGLFPVNILHNIVHLVIGIWGLLAYRSFGSARTFALVLGIFYLLLAVMGLIPGLNTTFGLIPIFGNDVWLHALTAIAALIVYFVSRNRDDAVRTTDVGA